MKKTFFFLFLFITMTANAFCTQSLNDSITRAGDIGQYAIPLSALTYSLIMRDWQGVGQLGLATSATLGTTYALKYTTREERPYQKEDSVGHTFPSGHTAAAFAGAGYWHMRYGWYVGAPMYTAAAFVGYSRNHAKMHNWLDIATAAAIGIGFNYLFTTEYIPKDTHISVYLTDDGAALRLSRAF